MSPDGASRLITAYEPVGVAAVITPWNFPSSMLARKVAPALAAGCTVVIKPASECPLSSLALINLAIEAGIPKNAVQIVTSSVGSRTVEIGRILSTHSKIAKLSFTGSTKTGRLLMQQASSTLKRLSMELGGHAPFIVLPDADLTLAVDAIVRSRFRNCGQTCICANRILIHSDVFSTVKDMLLERVQALVPGDAFDEKTSLGPLIHENARSALMERLQIAKTKDHINFLCGGSPIQPNSLKGAFFQPTLITDVPATSNLMTEEIFGPVAVLIPFNDLEEATRLANSSDYGLAAYIFSKDLETAWKLADELEVGMVGINEVGISMVDAPFGGIKQSGFGREGAEQGILEYQQIKYLNVKR